MSPSRIWLRFENRYRETQSRLSQRRLGTMTNTRPLVSFTFDDVPKSSCTLGREILEGFGFRATYYLSLSLMDSEYSIGPAFSRIDLGQIVASGHEIGSHTFGHLDAWSTPAGVFEASLQENQRALDAACPGRVFKTFSYPLSTPHPRIKKVAGDHFLCCRGGGQTFNLRTVDLNLLKSYFIDGRNRDDLDGLKKIVDTNCEKRGWLIFSTHDIDGHPSPYGCSPRIFEDLVRHADRSGAGVMPVSEVCSSFHPAFPEGADV